MYNIWEEREKMHPYQINKWTGKEPARELETMNTIMKPVLFKIGDKIAEFPELDSIYVDNLKVYRKPNGSGIVINVDLSSSKQRQMVKDFRKWCADNFDKSDSKLRFHVSLGYFYKEVKEDLEPELTKLQDWITKNIPYIKVRKPTPVLFTSMEKIIPYYGAFQEHDGSDSEIPFDSILSANGLSRPYRRTVRAGTSPRR